jgi:hypothetical protein
MYVFKYKYMYTYTFTNTYTYAYMYMRVRVYHPEPEPGPEPSSNFPVPQTCTEPTSTVESSVLILKFFFFLTDWIPTHLSMIVSRHNSLVLQNI